MTRCKFKCESKTITENGATVKLVPVTSGSPENAEFYKWTPTGELTLNLIKNEVAEQFIPGKAYYIDITLAE